MILASVCIHMYISIITCCLHKFLDDDSSDKAMKINFSRFKDVSSAFAMLFTICQNAVKVSNEEFRTVRNSCVAQASEPLRGLIKRATDAHCLFEVLADNNKYCNWINVRFLKVIAIACGNEELQSLIDSYKDVIYSKTLREVWDCIPHYSVRDKYYSELKATFGDKDPDNMTVEELIKSKPQLAKKIAMLIAVVEEDSIKVTWLIPTDEIYQAYLSFLTVPQQLRKDKLIQFGTWMAYPPQLVLQKYVKDLNCGKEVELHVENVEYYIQCTCAICNISINYISTYIHMFMHCICTVIVAKYLQYNSVLCTTMYLYYK